MPTVAILLLALAAFVLGYMAGRQREWRRRAALETEHAALAAAAAAERDKLAWTEAAEQRLREAFTALASDSLRSNSEEFLRQARGQLDTVLQQVRGDWGAQREQFAGLVQPVEKQLQALDQQVRQIERLREGAYRTLEQHLQDLRTAHRELRDETGHLRTALTTSSQSRGRWGELQLRRLVELAGMVNHVDFDEQQQAGAGRPDMLVHLPNEGILPVDAKTPLADFLRAAAADNPAERDRLLASHAQAMRNHVRALSAREYWQQFERTPDVVVMFIPNEASLGAAFEQDPDLLEQALGQHVLLATPVTLFGLLKAVAFGWQQHAVAENARAIAQQGKELCERLGVFLDHLGKAGRGLEQAVRAYNTAVGSAESRLVPAARRLGELGASARSVAAPAPVEQAVRPVADRDPGDPDEA
jgi:DNA recombination protein RmuC